MFTKELEETILPGKHVFYFSKINIHEKIESEAELVQDIIHNEIPRVILSAKEMKSGQTTVSFTDIIKIELEGNNIIKGNLTTSKYENIRLKDGASTYYSRTEKEVAASAMFMYFIEKEILVFETISKIPLVQFTKLFTKLLSSDPKVGKVKIFVLPEEHKLDEELKLFDKITSIEFNLIHPNPRSIHYNKYYNMVTDSGAKEIDVKLKDAEDGLNLNFDDTGKIQNKTIKDGVEMVELGYGSADIRGVNVNYIDGKRPKTKKKVTKSRRFDSSKSHKSLSFKGAFQKDIIVKVTEFLNKIIK